MSGWTLDTSTTGQFYESFENHSQQSRFWSHFLVDWSASRGSWHGAIATATSLDVIAVHSSCSVVVEHAHVGLLLFVVVYVFEVERVDMAREVATRVSIHLICESR